MPVNILGTPDTVTEAIRDALQPYAQSHPAAEVHVYRYSPVSVRARIVDPEFRNKSRSERHKIVWPLLYRLDEDSLAELTMLVLLPPEERDSSVANKDFDAAWSAKTYSQAVQSQAANGTAP
jgi:hypothetical protein